MDEPGDPNGSRTGLVRPTLRLLVRNSSYNVVGQALPLAVAIGAIPLVVHALGTSRFGVLGLFWMFLAIVEGVGFGRAGTRFLAVVRSRPGTLHAQRRVVRITVAAQMLLGLAVGASFAALAGPMATDFLRVDPSLQAETAAGFLLLGLACPILTTTAALRGFLQADQRFGVVNVIRVAGDSLHFLLPAAAAHAGWGISGIMALLVGQRLAVAVALTWVSRDILFVGGNEHLSDAAPSPSTPALTVTDILGFGAWSTVTSTASPILGYADRFLLGALAGTAAVGIYTPPFDVVMQVLIVPASIAAVVFPAVSTLHGQGHLEDLRAIRRRAVLANLAIVGLFALAFIVFGGAGLRLWLGDAATPEAVLALQILAPGVLGNALATVPFATLQGIGRADVTGKIHLLELPIQLGAAWWMVANWGVVGAAGAWTFRAVLDCVLMHWAAARVVRYQN